MEDTWKCEEGSCLYRSEEVRGKNDDHGYFHNCHDNDFRQKFQSSVSVIGRLTIASNPTDIPGVICFSSRNIEPEQKMKK